MRVYLCGDTAHDLDSRRNQVRLNVANDRKEEGFQESRKGRGKGIQYDQLVKHGCINSREIKVSRKMNSFEYIQSWVTANPTVPGDGTLRILEGSHLLHEQFSEAFQLPGKDRDWHLLTEEQISLNKETIGFFFTQKIVSRFK